MGLFLLFDLFFWPLYLLDWIAGRRYEAGCAEAVAASPGDALGHLIGATGVTRTPLRPVGKVIIEGKTHHARSVGPVIDAGCPVVVVAVRGGELVVSPVDRGGE
ncbi:MAG: NfeD family protein [Gammaproteobacteria bacterium]|nr:NfeD family protein [Gammaproteobacteria bacterium]